MTQNLKLRGSAFTRRPFTRRQAIELLSASAGAAIAASFGGSAQVQAAAKTSPKKPAKAGAQPIIRTLLKDVPPDALGSGAILFHEHLSIRYPVTRAMAE